MCLAIPGRILSVQDDSLCRRGMVDFAGIKKSVNLSYVPEAALGDFVLVHVGIAISRIDPHEAAITLATIEEAFDAVPE